MRFAERRVDYADSEALDYDRAIAVHLRTLDMCLRASKILVHNFRGVQGFGTDIFTDLTNAFPAPALAGTGETTNIVWEIA